MKSSSFAFHGEPCKIDLDPGKYYWCACGLSQKQPFCDGSHKKDEKNPRSFVFFVDKPTQSFLCGCKKTASPPFCDGSHQSLKEKEMVGL